MFYLKINYLFSYLTPCGVSSPLKDSLLARFPHVRATFNQAAFIESLNLSPQVLADIWLPVGFPPVSFDPLSEEEEKVAQSGQFSNSNSRTRNSSNVGVNGGNNSNYSQNSGGEFYQRNNTRGGPRPNRSRGGSFVSANNNPRSSRQDYQEHRSGGNYGNQNQYGHGHHNEEEVIENADDLWATPSSDTFGSTDFGSFDENGMFRAAGAGNSNILDGGLEDFNGSAAAFDGFMQTRHHQVTQQAAPAPVPVILAPPLSPPVAIPHITPDTQWLYRDPSGQIQGPFPSSSMYEWFKGKYFPENLPLRREQDAFFEPLSTWKTKCSGQVPFIAFSVAKPQEPQVQKQPLSFGSINRNENVSVSQWFSESESVTPAVNKVVAPSVSVSAPTETPSQTTRSVPIESLFNLQAAIPAVVEPIVSIEKPASPEVMMPTWKKLEKPSVTTKFGQMSLEPEIVSEPKIVESSVKLAAEPVFKSVAVNEPVKPAVVNDSVRAATSTASVYSEAPKTSTIPTTSSWTTSPSASAGSLKKISLSEIMKSNEEPNIILEKEKPSASSSIPSMPSVAGGSGWAKLSASPVQSLSSIQAEEAARQRSNSASVVPLASPSSKSFADLVRSAGVIQGNIIVSAPSVGIPEQVEHQSIDKKPNVVPVVPVPTASNLVSKPVTSSIPSESLEDWCISSLKQSPSLSKSIDPLTCTILLMDLPSPSALLTFSLETLKPLESSNFDLSAFIQEFSIKKFGVKASEKVQWNKLKISPQIKKQEDSFEVVKRKK